MCDLRQLILRVRACSQALEAGPLSSNTGVEGCVMQDEEPPVGVRVLTKL